MSGYDGHVYPDWSGLNDDDQTLDLEASLKHAISTVRYVWKDDSRASREVLARHITGSECISLLYALEGSMVALRAALTEGQQS